MYQVIYQRSFGGLSPPPPSIRFTSSGNSVQFNWNRFPDNFKYDSSVSTYILYKEKEDRNASYALARLSETNLTFQTTIPFNTQYDFFIGSVNSRAKILGSLERFKVQLDKIQNIPIKFCSDDYNYTKLPNIFGHGNENETILSFYQFGPLLDTGCSSDLKNLLCAAHFPRYFPKNRTLLQPCPSLCKRVLKSCNYAINELKFKWPVELNCTNLTKTVPCLYRKYISI